MSIQRFWSKVSRTDYCWLWTAGKDGDGYGLFWYNGKQVRAPRFILQVILKKNIGTYQVCHTCDNPSCVRPSHLFCGTGLDNAADREAKGRGISGRKQTEEHVKKRADARRGKGWTPEMRKRMSDLKRGIITLGELRVQIQERKPCRREQ